MAVHISASTISTFETSICFLSGLLSAYDLSGDRRLLLEVHNVGEMISKAFDTPETILIPRRDLQAAARGERQATPSELLLAELRSHTMEFTRLSLLSKFANKRPKIL
jgi:mannosyl-oligosaccharide alpha-1,2-mannosidase